MPVRILHAPTSIQVNSLMIMRDANDVPEEVLQLLHLDAPDLAHEEEVLYCHKPSWEDTSRAESKSCMCWSIVDSC